MKFIRSHMETVLVLAAAICAAAIGWFLYAAVQLIVVQAGRSIMTAAPAPQAGFDLQGAATIDYRGLIATSTASETSTATQ